MVVTQHPLRPRLHRVRRELRQTPAKLVFTLAGGAAPWR